MNVTTVAMSEKAYRSALAAERAKGWNEGLNHALANPVVADEKALFDSNVGLEGLTTEQIEFAWRIWMRRAACNAVVVEVSK